MSRGTETAHKQLNVLRCKLVIVGDATVGKTALAQVFQSGGSTYPKNYMMVRVFCNSIILLYFSFCKFVLYLTCVDNWS